MCRKNVRVLRFTFVILQYCETLQNFIPKLRKINYKNVCSSTHYNDNTVLVSSKDTSAPTVIENLE